MVRKKRWLALAICVMAALTVAACNNGGNSNTGSNSNSNTSSSSSSSSGANASGQSNSAQSGDANVEMGKFDPPIELTAARPINSAFPLKEGETYENNLFTKAYSETLGIQMKYTWTADYTQYDQKMNLAITSGDLPEVFVVNKTQLNQLAAAGQLEDITEVYEAYATERAKNTMEEDGGLGLSAATFGGKLYGLPQFLGSPAANILWVRTDWMEKLNLPEPKTIDDLATIADAFVNRDPDGNGVKDTIGLGFTIPTDGFLGAVAFIDPTGFFNGYHGYPNQWIDDGSGNLIYGSIQPEIKTALGKLRDMYSQGLIDREFGVKNGGKLAEDVASGKIGMMYGKNWNPYYPLGDSRKDNPAVDWKPYAIPSADGQPAKVQEAFPADYYYVAKKGIRHPEALIQILNFGAEKVNGSAADYDIYGIDTADNRNVREFAFIPANPLGGVNDYRQMKEAFDTNDASKLTGYRGQRYGLIKSFLEEGESGNWPYARQMGPEDSAYAVLDAYETNDLVVQPGFFGAPTPTMVDKSSVLDKLQNETFIKIIMGETPLDAFDTFVGDWKKLGGEAITQEVNDWLKSR